MFEIFFHFFLLKDVVTYTYEYRNVLLLISRSHRKNIFQDVEIRVFTLLHYQMALRIYIFLQNF